MNFKNSLIVAYKKPTSYKILKIMKDENLFESEKLLKNIEKVIPVSKVLIKKKDKNVKKIFYEHIGTTVLFYLYF